MLLSPDGELPLKQQSAEPQQQFLIGALLLLAVNLNGLLTYFPTELVQRRTFQETRKSVENRIQLLRDNEKQDQILLSVLPKHIAHEMKKDFDQSNDPVQFHKIYIQKHDNIRYVGFWGHF